jgi:hypothetical protein
MIRVNRRLLAWIVSIGLGCLAVGIVMRDAWPALWPPGGGFGAISVGFPSLIALPVVIGNIALGVIARRRGGRAASIGSRCLWTIGSLVVVSLAVSLTPPAVFQVVDNVAILVLMLLVGMGMSLPTQLVILAFLVFAVVGSSRTGTAGHTV